MKDNSRHLLIVNDSATVPVEMKKHQRNCTVSYKTAKANVVIGDGLGKKILSVIYIVNDKEGNGNASKLIKYLDGYARQCRCKEIWYPTVLNLKLAGMLVKRGYKLIIVKDKLFGEVDIFRKIFHKQDGDTE